MTLNSLCKLGTSELNAIFQRISLQIKNWTDVNILCKLNTCFLDKTIREADLNRAYVKKTWQILDLLAGAQA